jgi:hypothetical protein
MPGMTQCRKYTEICSNLSNSKFCGASNVPNTPGQAGQFCTPSGKLCISGMPGKSNIESCFLVSSKFNGWIGFGIGSGIMQGSDMYIGYLSNGELVLKNYLGAGPLMPQLQKSSLITSSKLTKGKLFEFNFCRNSTGDNQLTKKHPKYLNINSIFMLIRKLHRRSEMVVLYSLITMEDMIVL